MREFTQKLLDGQNLTPDEAAEAMHTIMSGNASDVQIAGFLIALRCKGETPDEIASMVKVMREFAESIHPKVRGTLVDTCGTGGDLLKTFNVSTASMFVVAGAGVPVAKHGNRSVSSQCGSADVLEELGVKVDLEPKKVEKCIEKVGVGFMFAPVFHKAMKYVMPARKQLGVRTIFNVLGPLTNPANAKGQVVGVFDEKLTEKLANVLNLVGLDRAYVVHGIDGLDEFSTLGKTRVAELRDGEIKTYYLTPEKVGLKKAKHSDLAGGDRKANALILKNILEGTEKGPKRDIVLLNSAAGIVVGQKADTIKEGIETAKESIDTGKAKKKLDELIAYTQRK
ncbi:MAG: anthranilate phosphoribosyltransferase [Candidatus Altiarchaeota archaeon]